MTMNPLSSGVMVAVLALALGGQVMAQDGSGGSGGRGVGPMALQKAEQEKAERAQGQQSLAIGDRRFVQAAATSGMFELEAARLASSGAADAALQRYAATLVEDHTRANEDLRRLASAKGLQLPARLPAAQQRELDRMRQLQGEALDRAFLRRVALREHQQDIRRFEAASRNARDPELRAWASQMLPTLERHLSQARQLPLMSSMTGTDHMQGMGTGMGMMGKDPGGSGTGAPDATR